MLRVDVFFADWSILYVTVIIFGIIMAIGGIVWAICFCMGRYVSRAILVLYFILACSYITAAHGKTPRRLIALFPLHLSLSIKVRPGARPFI